MDRRRAVGIALVIVSACGFGSGAVFAKPVYASGVDWLTLLAWRFGLGAALSWVVLLASPDRLASLRQVPRRTLAATIALGVLYTGNSATYFAGLETVPASLAAFIVYIYPAIVAVLTLRLGRRLEGRRAWSALAMALVGVTVAVGGIDPTRAPPLAGLVLTVASPVIYSVWIVLAVRLSGERQSSGSRATAIAPEPTLDSVAAIALMTTATATVFWATNLALGHAVLPDRIPSNAWVGLIGVGVISTFVAIQTFYAGAQRIGAAQAALISTIEPAWTIALAAILLGERLGPIQLAGGALILLGVVVAQTGPAATQRTATPQIRVADE
jgi:drug/metabolite transporter (DMT)-like permease